MCIQSVGEKKCTQCNLSGPAIIINDGNFWRNHAKLQQVFYFWVGTVVTLLNSLSDDDHLSDSSRDPQKSLLCLRRSSSMQLQAVAKCRPCQGVSSSSGFGIFCAQAWSFSSSLKSAARAARAAVTLQLFGGLDLMSSLFVSVLLLPGKS